MRTIGFINWKGGVGKTTISINVAYALAEQFSNGDIKILFIDADKQGNASAWFGADPAKGTFSDLLLHDAKAEEVIQPTRYPHIDIIAADASLIQANYGLLENQEKRQDTILKEALKSVRDKYTLCIIDNPPDSNLPVLNCLEVMDDIIAVTLPNRFSSAGIDMLQEEINNYNEDLKLNLQIRGVVINQMTSFSYDFSKEIKKRYHLFPSIHGGKTAQQWLDRCINEKKSIYEFSARSGYARDIKKFVTKLGDVIMAEMTGNPVIW